MKLTKKVAVKLSDHTHVAYLSITSLATRKMKNGFRRFVHTFYVTITSSQRHKKRMHSFQSIHRPRSSVETFCQRHSKKTCVETKQI